LTLGHLFPDYALVERGRASWAPYPEVFKGTPEFPSKRAIWDVLRLGPSEGYDTDPAKRRAHSGHQFPLQAFDQLVKTLVPWWRTTGDAVQRAYDALIQKVGPCILIVCSQSGQFGLAAAQAAPEKVKALVLLEPAVIPERVTQTLTPMTKVPHLFVWGDFISGNAFWPPRFEAAARYRDQLQAAGEVVDWFDLPRMGIHGNSHVLMIARNSDLVAELVQGWLNKVAG
jgi:pimeloyl-ACP methyl ester carboxylesterase